MNSLTCTERAGVNHWDRSLGVPGYGEHHPTLHCSQRRKERGVFFFGQSQKFFSKFSFYGMPLASGGGQADPTTTITLPAVPAL